MVANESAGQAGSNDTMLDPKLVTDGFAVRMLDIRLMASGPTSSDQVWFRLFSISMVKIF